METAKVQTKRATRLENANMTTAECEAKMILRDLRRGAPGGEYLAVFFARVARRLGISERRVRAFWNGEARQVLAGEMDRLRALAAERAAKQEAAARHEHDALAGRIAIIEARLAAIDADFHGPARSALWASMGEPIREDRDMDRAMDD